MNSSNSITPFNDAQMIVCAVLSRQQHPNSRPERLENLQHKDPDTGLSHTSIFTILLVIPGILFLVLLLSISQPLAVCFDFAQPPGNLKQFSARSRGVISSSKPIQKGDRSNACEEFEWWHPRLSKTLAQVVGVHATRHCIQLIFVENRKNCIELLVVVASQHSIVELTTYTPKQVGVAIISDHYEELSKVLGKQIIDLFLLN